MGHDAYLNINDSVNKHRREAKAEAVASFGDDADGLLFPNAIINYDDFEFKNEELTVSGNIMHGNDQIAYVTFNIPIGPDMANEIIASYVKKLNKIKTIIEASS